MEFTGEGFSWSPNITMSIMPASLITWPSFRATPSLSLTPTGYLPAWLPWADLLLPGHCHIWVIPQVPCCSVAMSCLTLCDPIDRSTPGFPILHHLPECAQTHVHWVSDAIQPSKVSHLAQIGRLPPNAIISLSLSTSSVPGILIYHVVSDTCCLFNSKRLILMCFTNWHPLEPHLCFCNSFLRVYGFISPAGKFLFIYFSAAYFWGVCWGRIPFVAGDMWGSRTPNTEAFCKPV